MRFGKLHREEPTVFDNFESQTGIKFVSLAMGFVGAALGISFTPPMSRKMAFGALLSGLVFGAFGPELLAFAFKTTFPPTVSNGIAVIFGVGGMFIVPGVVAFWQGFKDDPIGWTFGILDKLRASRTPTTPPANKP